MSTLLLLPTVNDVRTALAAVLPQTEWFSEHLIHEQLRPAHANPDHAPAPESGLAAAYYQRQVERTRWMETLTQDVLRPAWASAWASAWPWTIGRAVVADRVVSNTQFRAAHIAGAPLPVAILEVPIFKIDRQRLTLRAQLQNDHDGVIDIESVWHRRAQRWTSA